jgi:DNA topoisomerase IB
MKYDGRWTSTSCRVSDVYAGVALTLPPESEEVAGFFAAMIETDHAQDAKFRENFFRDFKAILDEYPAVSSAVFARAHR